MLRVMPTSLAIGVFILDLVTFLLLEVLSISIFLCAFYDTRMIAREYLFFVSSFSIVMLSQDLLEYLDSPIHFALLWYSNFLRGYLFFTSWLLL